MSRQLKPVALFVYLAWLLMGLPGRVEGYGPGKMDIGAETQYNTLSVNRNPEASGDVRGLGIGQDYRLLLNGGFLKEGTVDSSLGLGVPDQYGGKNNFLNDSTRLDYGPWLHLRSLSRHETDRENLFTGSFAPLAPIQSKTRKYDAGIALDSVTNLDLAMEKKIREDVLYERLVRDDVSVKSARLTRETEKIKVDSNYRVMNFEDTLSDRRSMESKYYDVHLGYQPRRYVVFTPFFEGAKDSDRQEGTSLDSSNAGAEIKLTPHRTVIIRDRVNKQRDEDTRTNENVQRNFNEILVQLEPGRTVRLEFNYKTGIEDRSRDGLVIPADVRNRGARIYLRPLRVMTVQVGYNTADKKSAEELENLDESRVYMDVATQVFRGIRLSGSVIRGKQTNPVTQMFESDTQSLASTLQYQRSKKFQGFFRLDTSRNDNPKTGMNVKTDTASARIEISPAMFINFSFRTSAQESARSEGQSSDRLLNSVGMNLWLLRNMHLSSLYELIHSNGFSYGDEQLVDLSLTFSLGKFDISMRVQNRGVSGDNGGKPKTTQGDIKYRLSRNVVLSIRMAYLANKRSLYIGTDEDEFLLESLCTVKFT